MAIGVWIWAALAVLSGGSLLVGHPWTELLSRRRYDEQVRAHPLFARTNRIITAAWTAYYAVAASVTAVTTPWIGLAFTGLAPMLGWFSFAFGDRYARRRAAQLTQPPHAKETGGTPPMRTPAQEALRTMITDKSDEEILALAAESPGGLDAMLDLTMAGMTDALDADQAVDCVVGYEIRDGIGDGDGGSDSSGATAALTSFRVEVKGGGVTAERRPPTDARVVLQLSVPEYLRLITGLLDGTDAFMSGRMRIRGDVMFAPQIARMFSTA